MTSSPPLEIVLWRAVAVYRAASLGYATILIAANFTAYEHPAGGWAVLAVMAAWTACSVCLYARPALRRPPLLVADLAVAVGCLLATAWVERPERIAEGAPTLPVSWVAGTVIAWAVYGGVRERLPQGLGVLAAGVVGATGVLMHQVAGTGPGLDQTTVNGIVLLLLLGLVAGHVARLAVAAERRLAEAVELAAATRERERLARSIHDSVLQVLALVRRRGAELGGPADELGRLAGEQEAALRTLVGGAAPEAAGPGTAELGALLAARSSVSVTVSAPAGPVTLSRRAAVEIDAAVAAALDNVRRHCGPAARTWVLLEEDGESVTVSVRDDGPGLAPGRLEAAAEAGRLGVAQSIRGRIRDLGGTVSITSAPGEGTEIEMTVPVG